MMAKAAQINVRIELSKCSKRFISALAALMESIEHADQSMLEDSIRDAHADVKKMLTDPDSYGFSIDD